MFYDGATVPAVEGLGPDRRHGEQDAQPHRHQGRGRRAGRALDVGHRIRDVEVGPRRRALDARGRQPRRAATA